MRVRGVICLKIGLVGAMGAWFGVPPDAQAQSSVTVLDTITVTARKREEQPQDVPASLSVIEAQDLDGAPIDPIAGLARTTPNVSFNDVGTLGQNFGIIRGVGALGAPLNSLDSSIAYSINGAPTSLSGFGTLMLDVERVEVLRGPQGTLYGRNALGGAIHVVATPPDGEREFRLTGDIGTDGYRQAEAIAGGYLIDNVLAGRAALRWTDRDGDISNVTTSGEEGGAEILSGRGALRWTPTERTEVTFNGYLDFDSRDTPFFVLLDNPSFPEVALESEPLVERDLGLGSLEVTHDFGWASFTSLSSFQRTEMRQVTDDTDALLYSGFTGLPSSSFFDPLTDGGEVNEDENIVTQEFRLNSPEDSTIQWVAGFSYFYSDFSQNRNQSSSFFPNLNGENDINIAADTVGVFGDVIVPLTERLKASGGLRLSHDRQAIEGSYLSNGFPGTVSQFAYDEDYSDTYVTGRGALQYDWSEEFMSYISVARGYSSGGFDRFNNNAAFGLDPITFAPSTSWTYEAGSKFSSLDGTFQLGASVFFNDVKDGQLQAFDPAAFSFVVENQDYSSYGFEIEGQAQIAPSWDIFGGVGYTRARFDDVSSASNSGAGKGNSVPNVPELTASFGLQNRFDAGRFGGRGEIISRIEYQYVDERPADVANSFDLNDLHMINARVAWDTGDFSLYAFANNILDERFETFGTNFGPNARAAVIGPGRTLGVGATFRW